MRRIRNFCFKSIISPFQVSYCCLRHDTSPTSYNPARSAPRALRRLSVPPQGLVQTIRLPRVFLNRDSRPTAQIFADTSHGRESPRYLAVTSGHGHRGRRAHLFFAANQQVPRPFYERSWTAPLHRKVGLKSTNELIRINSGATKARMLTFMLMVAVGTRISPRPPHRSRRALLTHRAPPSGQTSCDKRFSIARRPTRSHHSDRRGISAQCPNRGRLTAVPLG